MVSTAGGENGEAWIACIGGLGVVICAGGTMACGMGAGYPMACAICAGGTMVAGTAVLGLGPVAGTPVAGETANGFCRAGTCMGIESMPI
jgi:hypothetical protein